MSFSPLKKLIKKRLERRDLQQGVTESEVKEKAEQLLKDFSFSNQVDVLKIKGNKIFLKANNSSVAQEVQLHQQQIVEKINEEVDKAEIKKLIFKSN